jgi:hypothetical protein
MAAIDDKVNLYPAGSKAEDHISWQERSQAVFKCFEKLFFSHSHPKLLNYES